MQPSESDTVTLLLSRARNGDDDALDELLPLVYDVLRRLSQRELSRMGARQTLSTTDLIHEAYLKLTPGTTVEWEDRTHFFRVAARAMRQVLVDRVRRRSAHERKHDLLELSLSGRRIRFQIKRHELLDLDQALDRLQEASERLHSVVELRFFGGLTEEEVAGTLGVSARTVRRDWTKARLFLHRELYPEAEVS